MVAPKHQPSPAPATTKAQVQEFYNQVYSAPLFLTVIIGMLLMIYNALTGPPRPFLEFFNDDWLWEQHGIILVGAALTLPLLLIDVLRTSNRIVGPIHRMRRSMRALAAVPAEVPSVRRTASFPRAAAKNRPGRGPASGDRPRTAAAARHAASTDDLGWDSIPRNLPGAARAGDGVPLLGLIIALPTVGRQSSPCSRRRPSVKICGPCGKGSDVQNSILPLNR